MNEGILVALNWRPFSAVVIAYLRSIGEGSEVFSFK